MTGNGKTSERIKYLLNNIIDADSAMYVRLATPPTAIVPSLSLKLLLLAVAGQDVEEEPSGAFSSSNVDPEVCAEPRSSAKGVASVRSRPIVNADSVGSAPKCQPRVSRAGKVRNRIG